MGSPYRRPNRFLRGAKHHPVVVAVGIACAVAVLLEVGAVTDFFGLVHHASGSKAPTGPDLNPHHEMILDVVWAVDYTGASKNYFSQINGASFCPECPELPNSYAQYSPPEIGIYFYFNVTNTAVGDESFSLPTLGTSGPDAALFNITTYCCFSTSNTPYSEPLSGPLHFVPGQTVGLRGYVWTTVIIPVSVSGNYTVYYNTTSA
ncbi:MAG: hypothetical protein ACLQD8_00745 [Thermoplasmata archaeon]